MKNPDPFKKNGTWYKAALHVHTTRSDGERTPEEVMEAYYVRGYHILCITDHETITDLTAYNKKDFLTIPSVEVSCDKNQAGEEFHLVVLGARCYLDLPQQTPAERAAAQWAQNGAVLFLAHPNWSGMNPPEIKRVRPLDGIEVFNFASQTDLGKGLASVHWDQVLSQKKRVWGAAVDDSHWSQQNGEVYDAFGAWTWIKAESLEEKQILNALKKGEFYSSTGPKIFDFRIENGEAAVHCSGVKTVNFIAQARHGGQTRAGSGRPINEARCRLTGEELYLRAECIDFENRTAWTNPVFLRGFES